VMRRGKARAGSTGWWWWWRGNCC